MSDASGADLTLEDYAMKAGYGRLTGVSIACHAIRDAYLLMHVGVGCKNKVTHLLAHDWEQHCNLRQGWTEVSDQDLIMGSSRRIGPYLRSWQKRMDSGYVVVVSVTFLELTGEDVEGEIRRALDGAPVPVDLIPALGFDGDEFDGYASVAQAVLAKVDWKRPVKRGQVSVLGYFFDRYEGDHTGNMVQLAGLLSGVGASLGPVLFSGRTYAEHLEVSTSEVLVTLPYLPEGEAAVAAEARTQGRRVVATDLPMGFAGTTRWLKTVGAALRIDPRKVAAYTDKREERARGSLEKMFSRWSRHRVAVFAEPPLAAGVCAMLLELGMQPTLVGLRGKGLGGAAYFRAVLERNGQALPEGAEVLEDPSLARIQNSVRQLLEQGLVDGIIGSATELNPVRTMDARQPRARAESPLGEPFVLELGFPCLNYHALQQMPFMGYGGVVSFAQRMIDAPRLCLKTED